MDWQRGGETAIAGGGTKNDPILDARPWSTREPRRRINEYQIRGRAMEEGTSRQPCEDGRWRRRGKEWIYSQMNAKGVREYSERQDDCGKSK